MDIATLLGLIAGIAIIAGAVAAGSDFSIFINLQGILIVAGGTAAAVLMKFPLRVCIESSIEGLKTAFIDRSEQPQELILIACQLSDLARRKGKLALENVSVRNPFLRKGLQMLADGRSSEFLQKVMTMEMDLSIERHQVGEKVFRAIGDTAPAFGLIGTLVGLVQMLSQMSDPTKLGMGMAVAILTTLYGALIAHLVAIPIADKLMMRAHAEYLTRALIMESLINIEKGENPRTMEEILSAYLPSNERQSIVDTLNTETKNISMKRNPERGSSTP